MALEPHGCRAGSQDRGLPLNEQLALHKFFLEALPGRKLILLIPFKRAIVRTVPKCHQGRRTLIIEVST